MNEFRGSPFNPVVPDHWMITKPSAGLIGRISTTAKGTIFNAYAVAKRNPAQNKEAVGTDDFLALGLIAFSYGSALLIGVYGFLAVFATGIACAASSVVTQKLRQMKPKICLTGEADELATDPQRATVYMAQAVLQFNDHVERTGEVAICCPRWRNAFGALSFF